MTETPTTPGKAPKKARRKVTTDLGRQLLTRERQRLSREQAALAEQQLKEAERRQTQQKRNTKSHKPLDVAISRSIVKRFAGVLASEGLQVRISATPARETSAWTDFEQIVINYQQHDDSRVMAASMRGLAYHEGGHCRFTLPFLDLAEAAGQPPARELHHAWNILEDQRMETAVVSDSPRKAAYLTPMVLLDLVPSTNHAATNWPLLIWRRFLPKNVRRGARKLFVTKHNLMGVDGEALAHELERVTTKYVMATDAVTMWNAVVEYQGLLQMVSPIDAATDAAAGHQRQYKRTQRNLDDYLIIPIDGGMGEDDDDTEEGEEQTQVETPEEFMHFLDVIFTLLNGGDIIAVIYAPQGAGEGKGGGSKGDKDKKDGQKPADEGDESDSKDDAQDGTDDGEGLDDDGMEHANDAPQGLGAGSSGTHKNKGVREGLDYKPEDEAGEPGASSDSELSDDDLTKALEEAEEARNNDPTLDGDVNALHEAINNRTSDLMPYVAGVSTDAEAQGAADNLAQDIEQAFQENTVDKAPGWLEAQRRGIVNVLRYETRRPGDVEFFRQYTDTDAPGQNISVSVLLDYSGSMGGVTKELAQVGYACKVACTNLEIPCTVVLWDTDATVLYDAIEEADRLPVIVSAGGTDPTVAVADLDRQRYEKDIHIVIIMTDGAWSGAAATSGFLANYKGDKAGRYFIGVGYDSGWGSSDDMAENLRRYGCDEAHGISNLMEIPRFLETALIAFA